MTVNKSVHRLSTVVLSMMRELDVIWSVIKYRCQKPRIIAADIALFEQVAGTKKCWVTVSRICFLTFKVWICLTGMKLKNQTNTYVTIHVSWCVFVIYQTIKWIDWSIDECFDSWLRCGLLLMRQSGCICFPLQQFESELVPPRVGLGVWVFFT